MYNVQFKQRVSNDYHEWIIKSIKEKEYQLKQLEKEIVELYTKAKNENIESRL